MRIWRRYTADKPDAEAIRLRSDHCGRRLRFRSSACPEYPIQVCVNELHFKARRENIILCGLWYGDRKPNLNTFLTPFIEELNSLHNTGFRLNEHDQYITKVHTLLCTVDSVARAPLQNVKTFRGEHGCSFCLNPGIEAAVGRGSTRLYQNDTLYPLRTQAQHIRDTQKIIAQPRLEADNGVKGMANLLNLALFDISQSFVPDYLHCVLLGCTKTMIRHWTDGKNKDQPFFIGNDGKINEIDSHLLRIKPPKEITRTPRTLHKWKYWRGHEF
ncbi:NAD kinase [Frankliniella fusca]|uniref:NAD kinase n=1 Tax=Frankliniella fusca TaxID=407009 RepID=A0AAE1I2C3_9NEOP|nr:NAD kinase [Frankliniella fusca]